MPVELCHKQKKLHRNKEGTFGSGLWNRKNETVHKSPNPSERIARRAMTLLQFDFDVIYRKGKQNVLADALSRESICTVDTRDIQSNE